MCNVAFFLARIVAFPQSWQGRSCLGIESCHGQPSSKESRESCQGRFRDPAGSARAPRAFAGAAGAASQPSAADTFPPLRSAGRPARDPAQRAQGAQAQARPSAAKRRARRRTGTAAGRMSARAGTRRHAQARTQAHQAWGAHVRNLWRIARGLLRAKSSTFFPGGCGRGSDAASQSGPPLKGHTGPGHGARRRAEGLWPDLSSADCRCVLLA